MLPVLYCYLYYIGAFRRCHRWQSVWFSLGAIWRVSVRASIPPVCVVRALLGLFGGLFAICHFLSITHNAAKLVSVCFWKGTAISIALALIKIWTFQKTVFAICNGRSASGVPPNVEIFWWAIYLLCHQVYSFMIFGSKNFV